MTADRKAIRRNLLNLMDSGLPIEYSESTRMVTCAETGEQEETYIWSDFYLKKEFDDSELRLLIDGLLFSRHIPYGQCKRLMEKIEGLSSVYFKSRVRHISRINDDRTDNKQLFLNIELLDEAINHQKKVAFQYLEYGTDKKLHPRKRPDGTVREYCISPYQMAAREGKYYLICNYDKYDDIANYRVDRIWNIRILDEPVKPFETLRWANGQALDLAEYMKRHVYMCASDNVHVRFRITRGMISDVIDMFGKDVVFTGEDESGVTVSVYTNEMAMEQFAKSFAPDVIVLEPRELAEKLKRSMEMSLEKYRKILGESENKKGPA